MLVKRLFATTTGALLSKGAAIITALLLFRQLPAADMGRYTAALTLVSFCAILANAGRVTVTGILSEWRTDLAQGFFHSVEGWIIFIVAMILMIITHQIINAIYRASHGSAKHA